MKASFKSSFCDVIAILDRSQLRTLNSHRRKITFMWKSLSNPKVCFLLVILLNQRHFWYLLVISEYSYSSNWDRDNDLLKWRNSYREFSRHYFYLHHQEKIALKLMLDKAQCWDVVVKQTWLLKTNCVISNTLDLGQDYSTDTVFGFQKEDSARYISQF